MITQIGLVAGDIWHYLDTHKDVTLDELIRNIGKPRELILMGLGWLGREGHVIIKEKNGNYDVELRKND